MQADRRVKSVARASVPVAAPSQKDSLSFLAGTLSQYGLPMVTAEDFRKSKYSDWSDIVVSTASGRFKLGTQPQELVPLQLNQHSGQTYSCETSLYSQVLLCEKQWRLLHGQCILHQLQWHPFARTKLAVLFKHPYSADFVRDSLLQLGAASSVQGPFLSMLYSPLSSSILHISDTELEALKELTPSQNTLWRITISASPRTLLLAILFLLSIGVNPQKRYFFEVVNDLQSSDLLQCSHILNLSNIAAPRSSLGYTDLQRVLHLRIQSYLRGETGYRSKEEVFLPYFVHRQGQLEGAREALEGVLAQIRKNKTTSKVLERKLAKAQKDLATDISAQPVTAADTPSAVSIVGPSVELYGAGAVARLLDPRRRDELKLFEEEHAVVTSVPAVETVIMQWGVSVALLDKEKGGDLFGTALQSSLSNLSPSESIENELSECVQMVHSQQAQDSVQNGHHLIHYHCGGCDTCGIPEHHCNTCNSPPRNNTMAHHNSLQLFQQLHNTCACTNSKCPLHATTSLLLTSGVTDVVSAIANGTSKTPTLPSRSIQGIKLNAATREVQSVIRAAPVSLVELPYLAGALDHSSTSAILSRCGKVTSRKARNNQRMKQLNLDNDHHSPTHTIDTSLTNTFSDSAADALATTTIHL